MKKIILSLSIDEAKLLHSGANQETKLELEKFFPELNPISIIDRVKTYEDALEELRQDHFDEDNLYPREIARRKLEIIIEALNEGWIPDLSNHREYKWYCCFTWSNTGLGYSRSFYSPTLAFTNVHVRLCLKSKELADYIGEQFKDLYKEMLLG